MTSTVPANEIRATQRETWDTFAPGWDKWDDVVQGMLGPVGEEMVRSLEVAPEDHHPDVASGTGEPGLTVAAVLSQLDEPTRQRIAAAAVAGVRAQCGDGPVRPGGMARCVGGRR